MVIKAKLAMSLLAVGAMPCTCTMTLTGIQAPAQVAPGQVFDITLFGTYSIQSCYISTPGCVLQLPNGFSIIGPRHDPVGGLDRDDPALLGMYQPEPGHYLASFSGSGGSGFSVTVQAPPQWSGSAEVAVALAYGMPFRPADPLNETDFANIGPSYRHRFTSASSGPGFDREVGSPVSFGVSGGVADVDGDGRDDLVGIDGWGQPARAIHVSRHEQNGWSHTSTPLPANAPSFGLPAFGDVDGDGDLDVVVAGGEGAAVWFGRGDGFFDLVPVWITGQFSTRLTVADLDGDGRDDVLVSGGGNVVLARSLGRSFAPQILLPLLGAQSGVAEVGDVTGDGLVDIVVATNWMQPSGGIEVLVGDSLGQWSHLAGPPGVVDVQDLVDLDGDGHLEVLSMSAGGAFASFWRAPTGWSVQPLSLPAAEVVARAIDLDGDDMHDVLAVEVVRANGGVSAIEPRLFRNLGSGGFAEVMDTGLATRGHGSLLSGDVDGDGVDDVIDPRLDVVWFNRLPGTARFGTGCAAGGVAPSVGTRGVAVQGNSGFGLELRGLTPGGFGVVWIGGSRRESSVGLPGLPFDLSGAGAPGCQLLADPAFVRWVAADGAGIGTLPLPIPATGYDRFAFFAQGAALVPGANPLGLLTSAGLLVRVD